MPENTKIRIPRYAVAPLGDGNRRIRSIGLGLVVLVLLAVVATFAILTGLTPLTPTAAVTRGALVANSVLLVMLGLLIVWELVGLGLAWKSGRAGARLHWRVISMFGLIAAVPAVLVTVLASITLDQGLDRWFETRTRTIVQNAADVGSAYVLEHARALRGDAIAMATDIDRAKQVYDFDPDRFDAFFNAQGRMRQIPAAFILKQDGTVVTSVKLLDQWENVLMPPPAAIAEAERDGASLIAPGQSNQVGVVVELKEFEDQFLYVARPMDARVLSQVRLAQSAAADYRQLEQSRSSTQMAFAVVFLGVTLALLLAAIWVGIGFANRLVAPIQRLVLAADYVSKGNLMVEVPVRAKEGDLALLGQTFNKMTVELRSQRAELVAANEQIDQRRRFTEAVLSGVNSGVIGVGRSGEVTLANRAALVLLDTSEANVLGKALADVMPEIAPVMSEIDVEPSHRTRHTQVVINRDGQDRTLNVRINPETEGSDQSNAVVTLDDITDLVTAQRSAAWADVARRIAHEIKNPLTPIQLSAERIRRRFGKLITDDGRAVFDQCVDTIIRQVGDIERMVNEFSAFARMPKPKQTPGDVLEPLKESVFLISVAHPDITFTSHLPDGPVISRFDARLLSQAFTNVVKNATEAIAAVPAETLGRGTIDVHARTEDGAIIIDVIDNGIGLPQENRNRLLEPYVTTREKGTGLGLAIVRKILEDHGGRIELLDAPAVASGGRGAMMRLVLPLGAEEPADSRPDVAASGVETQPTVAPGATAQTQPDAASVREKESG
jgi:two-component system nitrogen regulation sensor histidine kinase NtrY